MFGVRGDSTMGKELLHALGLSVAYFFASILAISFMRYGEGLSVIWIATSFLTADLRHRPNYSWMLRCCACLIADVAAIGMLGFHSWQALPLAALHVGEGVLSALVMRRYLPVPSRLETIDGVAVLILVPGMLSPAVTGLLCAALFHYDMGLPYWPQWLEWTLGHSLGALMVLPSIKLVLGGDFGGWLRKARPKDWLETGAILLTMLGVTASVFAQRDVPLLFFPLLPMMIAVFRLGRLGVVCAITALAGVAIPFTLAGLGPVSLISGGPAAQMRFLLFYLVTAMLMTLPAAAELWRRKGLLTRAEEAAALHRVIVDRTGDIILALELDGTIRFASASMEQTLGLSQSDAVGQLWADLAIRPDGELLEATQRMMQGSPQDATVAEFRMIKADGSLGWFESHARATIASNGQASGYVSVVREVSERKERELDLAKAAATDALSGLLNRRGFTDRFAELQTLPRPTAEIGCIALFDLDHFKKVNDLFGHKVGDEIIVIFAGILTAGLRSADLVARLGGEEFVAYLPDVNVDQAALICDTIRRRFEIQSGTALQRYATHATVSVGLTAVTSSQTLNMALETADRALYQAKAAGRNRLSLTA